MTWYAIYQNSDGKLVSIGDVVGSIPNGLTSLQLASRPDLQALVWDETNRSFIVRPAKVLIDRLTDIQSNPNYQDFMDAYNSLSAANKTKLRTAVVRLLGRYRYRAVNESVEL